ncbi:MAG: putative Ig domain-containing protein [Wenzhouxiangella sp.]
MLLISTELRAEPQVIALDEEVSGTIVGLQERVFALSGLEAGERVYLARTGGVNVNQMSWSLEDRFGRVIAQDLATLGDLGPVSLMGGDYTVTVRGKTGATDGQFSFILHAVEDSETVLALDQTASPVLGGVGATHTFTLDLPSARPVRLLFGGPATGSQLSYRLTDAVGNVRVDWSSSVPLASDRIGLPAGTNRIEVRGRNQYAGAFSLQVRPQTEPSPSVLALNAPVAYASADVSEQVAWSFTLAGPTRVFPAFEFAHAATAAQWRLVRADGQVVIDWGTSLAGLNEPLDLAAGDYVLSLRSRAATAVSGTLTLHEVIDQESPLAPDTPATAMIDVPGQEQRFQFTALAAGAYLLDRLDTDNGSGLSWRLEDALGRTIVARTGTVDDVERIDLAGGDYTLTVSGNDAATGFVDFALTTIMLVDVATTLGSVIDDAIVSPGEIRRYAFSATAGTQLAIRREASSNTFGLNYILHDTVGRELIARTAALLELSELNLAGGDYQLTVLGEGGETGSFRLALDDLGSSGFVPTGTPLALDGLTNGTISIGAPQQWQLSLADTQRVYFELVEGATNLRWTLFDAGGQPVFGSARATFPDTDDRGPFMLAAGDYTLEFELTSGDPAAYAFRAVDAGVLETAINLDQIIDGAPTVPGFRNDYVFDVAAEGRFYFELRQGVSQLRWQLLDAAGRTVFRSSPARVASDSIGPLALGAGEYRLIFEATSAAAPAYQFQIHTVTDLDGSLSLGSAPLPVSGSMAMPGQRHEYALTLEPGVERLYVQVQSGNNALRYSLLDSAGRRLVDRRRLAFAISDDTGPLVVEPGDYRLLIEMVSPTTSDYALTLHAPEVSPAQATALDQLESWTPAGPGDEQRFAFNLSTAGTRAFFDPRSSALNVFATLTHLPSGWTPFADVHLQFLSTAVRGPFALPAGDYELTLRALPSAGAPSWQLSSVVDEPVGSIGVNEVVVAEFPMPGARLSYTFTPDQDGQPLIFDLMSAAGNQWELVDPVGTPVFGPASAADFTANDQGPVALAAGPYTLTFSNTANQVRDWLFRVGSASGIVEVPEGCAACSALDLLFTFDTSVSMDPVNQAMCDLAGDLVEALADDGIPVNANYWGITENGSATCLNNNVGEQLGSTVPGSPPSWMDDLENCAGFPELPTENWGPAAAIVAERYPWQADAVRLLVPVADEGPYCGDPVDEFDIDSVYFAREIAAQNDVVVSPLLPDIAPDPVRAMAGLITVGTGGISTVADFDLADILPVARSIAIAACGTATTIAAPEFTDLSPRPGTLLPSGVPMTLSGRVLPVNQLRPVLEVEVNGESASILDGSGSFFATIELQPGPNQVTISAVEACGPTVLEIELIGAGDEANPWAEFAELSGLLQTGFSATSFDPNKQRLLVDVAANNPGAALKGPILMAVGLDLHPGVELLNADGVTPNGEPYVVLVAEGETLPGGGRSAVRELAFSNPGLEPIDFEPRWLLPANQAPHFTSVPTTRATVGRPWVYPATAEDGDGDSLSWALLVAPAGMSQTGGQLSWTPTTAGSFDVVLRVSDGRGGVSRQSFSVNVVEPGFNAPPIFTSAPVIQAPIGADYRYQAVVVDPDGDSVGFALPSAPTGLDIDSGSGLLTWTNAQPGRHSVIIEADDGQGGQATQSYTLFVGEPADTPAGPGFVSTPVSVAAVGTQYRYRYQLSPPQTPAATVALSQGPATMSLDSAQRTIEWLPETSDLGSHIIELVATDAAGQQATQRFELNVLDNLPNQAPYVTSTPPLAAVVGQLWTYSADAVDPEFESLAFSLADAPDDMQIDAVTGEVNWTPPPGTPASVSVQLVVTDPQGLAAEQAFDIAVRSGNADPVLSRPPPAEVFVGDTYNHLFIGNDADGDTLTFTLLDSPTGMTLDAEAGWLSWSTLGVTPGAYEFEIGLADDWGGSASRRFTVNVVEDTEAPIIEIAVARQPACAAESVAVCVQASDNVGLASRELLIDGQPQTLSAGCFDWTPPAPGNVPALATATDVSGLSASDSRSLQVADCTDGEKPVVTLVSPQFDELLLKPTPLVVSIDDDTPAALTWEVSIRAGLQGAPQPLAEGSGPVDESEVAMIDPSLLPEGEYWIGILASDGVQAGGIEFRVNVGGGFKPGRVRSATADVIMRLAGSPLTIGRSYDSLDAGRHGSSPGDLGPGWRLALSGSVSDSAREPADPDDPLAQLLSEPFSAQTRVTVIKPDGERVGFTFAPKPKAFPSLFQFDVNFQPDPGVDDVLRAVDGPQIVFALGAGFADFIIPYNPSVYELETPDKVVYVISETEGLVEIRNALGDTLTINDDGIQSSTGVSIDYVRDSQGRVAEVQVPPAEAGEPPGRILYGYDAIGNLHTVTDLGGGLTTFEYANADYPHHVTAVIDPRGEILTQQIYDDQGRLIAQCPADGNSATLEGCSTYDYDVAGGVQTVFDTRGFQSDFVYAENGLLILQRDWVDAESSLEQRWIYNEDGYVIEYIDRAGGSTISTYDERGNQLSRREPGGQLFTWTYGECSRFWETATDPLGNTWQNDYDENCQLRFSTDPLGEVTEYQYAAPGLRSAVIDPLAQTWDINYNDFGLESGRSDPTGASRTIVYDNRGIEVSVTDREGQQRSFVTDEAGLLQAEIWVGANEQLNFDYNEVGLVTSEGNSDQTLSIDYFPTGRVQRLEHSSASGPDWWVEYLYDGNGNVTRVTDFAGGTTWYEYDAFDQLIAVSQSGPGINDKRVEFELNPFGLITAIRRYGDLDGNVPGPTTAVEYACDSCPFEVNRIEHRRPDGSPIHEMTFARNAIGLVTQMIDAQGTHDFIYNGRGWLVSASHPPIAGFNDGSITWDAHGNWLSLPGKPGPASLSYADDNGGHRLLSDGEMTYLYDQKGAVISRVDSATGETLNLDYDTFGRLTGATLLDSGGVVDSEASFGYTPSGARTYAEVDGVRRHFVYDGENVILVLDDSGQVLSRRLQIRAVDRPLAVDDGNEIRWLLADHLGSIRNVVSTSGDILAEFAYTPFGEQVLGPPPTLDDSIRFTGREFDIPGGLGYYRARIYAPDIARFLSEDPVEPWHYRYAENNPLRYTDPSGKVAAISYALQACKSLARLNKIFSGAGSAGAGEFIEKVLLAANDGLNGKPVDVQEILDSIKKLFAPKAALPCGFKLDLT